MKQRPAPRQPDDRPATAWQTWKWPVVLGLLTGSGLVSALVSDTWGDGWSWLTLGVSVAVMAWFGLRRPSSAPADRN